MAKRFYVLPKVGAGTHDDPFRAKYISELGVQSAATDFGREDSMLVGAEVTGAQHTTLTANTDVISIPAALDDNISAAALATVQSKVEGLKIPANHLTTAQTYRDVVRLCGKVFFLAQRFDGLHAKTLFDIGAGLSTQFGDMAPATRTNLLAAVESLGLSTSQISSTTTLRQILRGVVDGLPSFTLFGETF